MKRLLTTMAIFGLVFGSILGTGWAVMHYFDLKVMTVTSGSMEPMLPVGSRIIVRGDVPAHRNDVVAFHNPDTGGVTTHIYGGLKPDGALLTRGMANKDQDAFSPAPTSDDIVGVMIAHTQVFTLDFWTTPRGIGIIMIVLAVACLIVLYHRLGAPQRAAEPLETKEEVTSPV